MISHVVRCDICRTEAGMPDSVALPHGWRRMRIDVDRETHVCAACWARLEAELRKVLPREAT